MRNETVLLVLGGTARLWTDTDYVLNEWRKKCRMKLIKKNRNFKKLQTVILHVKILIKSFWTFFVPLSDTTSGWPYISLQL